MAKPLRAALAPLAAMLVIAGLGLSGCGKSGPTRVPVEGQVLLDGKPVTIGFIRVIPKDARPSTSGLDSEGRFKLRSKGAEGKEDGCVLGTHPVIVDAHEMVTPAKNRWYAPSKYADAQTSGLTVTITGPTNNLVIELKGEGQKYPLEERSGEAVTE